MITKEMWKIADALGRHGAKVMTAAGERVVCGAFYAEIIRFCEEYRINCLGFDMTIPETDEPMMLAIWRDGRMDSGCAENVRMCMEQN